MTPFPSALRLKGLLKERMQAIQLQRLQAELQGLAQAARRNVKGWFFRVPPPPEVSAEVASFIVSNGWEEKFGKL